MIRELATGEQATGKRVKMFYATKILQAIGLGAIAIGFLVKFPHLMDPKLFISGIVVFIAGWLLERIKR